MVQPRAAETRAALISAAVALFADVGYAETTIADICKQAFITKGAFYYHFTSKEDVAEAIHASATKTYIAALERVWSMPMRALEKVMRGIYIAADLVLRDPVVWVSSELRQAVVQAGGANEDATTFHEYRLGVMSGMVAEAAQEGDVRGAPAVVTEAIRAGTLGAIQVAHVRRESPHPGITNMWAALLPGIVAEDALPHYQRLLGTLTAHYSGS